MSVYTQGNSAINSGALTQTEAHLYGSSRLGLLNLNVNCAGSLTPPTLRRLDRGNKLFELTNHLGNVQETITDKKLQHTSDSSTVDYYLADVLNAQDYYPFGMLMPGRSYTAASAGNYRYGFNGKENDNEVKGVGDQIDYGNRIYDPRLGRFLSVDPLQKKYPELTPYQFASNGPIANVDLDGRESYWYKFDIDKKTGTVVPTLVAVKTSWLDVITLSHLVVKIGELDWQYDADFCKSCGELDREIELIKKDPTAYLAKMQKDHKETDEAIAKQKAWEKDFKERAWAIAFAAKYSEGLAPAPNTAVEEEAVAAHGGNPEATTNNNTNNNRGLGTAQEDVSKRNPQGQAYEDEVTGASSDVTTRKRIVPTLKFVNGNPNGRSYVKFDGFDVENNELIDRKLSITSFPKALNQLERMSEALKQNPTFKGVIEVPNQAQYNAAIRVLQKAQVQNISVRIVKPN